MINPSISSVSKGDDGRLHLTLKVPNQEKAVHMDIRTHWWLTGVILSWLGKAVKISYTDTDDYDTKEIYINIGSLFKRVYYHNPDQADKEFNIAYKAIRDNHVLKNISSKPLPIDKCLQNLSNFLKGADIKINQIWKNILAPDPLISQKLLFQDQPSKSQQQGQPSKSQDHSLKSQDQPSKSQQQGQPSKSQDHSSKSQDQPSKSQQQGQPSKSQDHSSKSQDQPSKSQQQDQPSKSQQQDQPSKSQQQDQPSKSQDHSSKSQDQPSKSQQQDQPSNEKIDQSSSLVTLTLPQISSQVTSTIINVEGLSSLRLKSLFETLKNHKGSYFYHADQTGQKTEYVIWVSEPPKNGVDPLINIQPYTQWDQKNNQQRLGLVVNNNFDVTSIYIETKKQDSIPDDKQYLVQVFLGCAIDAVKANPNLKELRELSPHETKSLVNLITSKIPKDQKNYFFTYPNQDADHKQEYVLWVSEPKKEMDLLINIQPRVYWESKSPEGRLGFTLDKNFNITSIQIDKKQQDAIPDDKQHLVQAFLACAMDAIKQKADAASIIQTEYSKDLTIEEQKEILTIRRPLINQLKKYFELDPFGYIIKPKDGISVEAIDKALMQDEKGQQPGAQERKFAMLFCQISRKGDAAYAKDIHSTLASMGIVSSPVDKDVKDPMGKDHTGKDPIRPASYVKSKITMDVKVKEPGIYMKPNGPGKNTPQPAYLSRIENAIWFGYRQWRHGLPNYKKGDKVITASHKMDLLYRSWRAEKSYIEGKLVVRVSTDLEMLALLRYHYLVEPNDILSTTVLPQKLSPLEIKLFCEFNHDDTIGMILDFSRVAKEDFGVGFHENAATVGQGFLRHKLRRQELQDPKNATKSPGGICGASSIEAQKRLLADLSRIIKEGGSVGDVQISLSPDGSRYEIKNHDARSGRTGKQNKKDNVILWNEQTIHRPIAGRALIGFFVKSDSNNFSTEIRRLLEVQARCRRTKGFFPPIFLLGRDNTIEPLIPDPILISITGAQGVEPIPGAKNRISLALEAAGITESLAIKVSNLIKQPGTVKSLFELQLLMFNMKGLGGQMTLPVHVGAGGYCVFESVRILDNFHLVFPTNSMTKNHEAKQKELFFSDADLNVIKGSPDLLHYLSLTLNHNLEWFLGISVSKSLEIKVDLKNLALFDQSDLKKGDFAKVISRGLQAAVLFQIYGKETNKIVTAIVVEIRKSLPCLGFHPGGTDMILGSHEMQNALTKSGFGPNALSVKLEPAKSVAKKIAVPQFPYSLDQIDPFQKIDLPKINEIKTFLLSLGVDDKGAIGDTVFSQFQQSDPHLIEYESSFIKAIHLLYLIKEDRIAQAMTDIARINCPEFGFTATGEDMFLPNNDALIRWVQEELNQQSHQTEFPFVTKAKVKTAGAPARGRGRFDQHEEDDDMPVGRGGLGRFDIQMSKVSVSNEPKIDAKGLQKLVEDRKLIPPFSPDQERVAKKVGLVDKNGTPLWMIEPTFHGGDPAKPTAPFIEVRDFGHTFPQLLTGPAYESEILKGDRGTFELAINPKIITPDVNLEHLVTDTLAMTTEGDKQVLRQNGLQYSQAINPPTGGNIDFSRGNEKHRFCSNDERKYHESKYQSVAVQNRPKGRYTDIDLKIVENYDLQLLSDQKRRLKRVSVLPSAYLTVTGAGGYGSERKPLKHPCHVLYLATAGAQFEKYNRGPFKYQNGPIDENELEATDFIIKKGAGAQKKPLFPSYYPNGQIPAHHDIAPNQCSKLGDGDFNQPYVTLEDGAIFNRTAFQNANDEYMFDLVIPELNRRMSNEPYYLKATLFGGGFFAQTDTAGNLRPEVVNTMLNTYIKAINQGCFPAGSVIEFPRYGEQAAMPAGLIDQLKLAAAKQGIEIVWTPDGSVDDYREQESLTGKKICLADFLDRERLAVLGAADVMSWHGNEPSSASVEAAFFNNSNGRLVMNWWANPKVLEEVKRVAGLGTK